MKRKYYVAALISIPAFFLICMIIARFSQKEHNADTEEGMSYLDAMNVYNVQSVEDRINSIRTGEVSTLETQTSTEAQSESESERQSESESHVEPETPKGTVTDVKNESQSDNNEVNKESEKDPDPVDESVSYKEIFDDSLFVGDSIMTGFDDYRIVNSGNVIAHVGSTLDHHLADNTQTIINFNPDTLILHYGLNEIGEAQHYLDEFIERYTKDLEVLKNALPDTKIIVVGLMPVKQEAIDREARFGRVDAYNERLEKMCEELGVNFYMNEQLFSNNFQYYAKDGIHFAKKLYLIWMEDFVKEMGLN